MSRHKRNCRSYAAKQPGWKITKEYADDCVSGTVLDRPGYQELLEDLRAGQLDIILAESLDRFSRDQADLLALYQLCIFCGVRIFSVHGNEATKTDIAVRGLLGSLDLDVLAARTVRGQVGRLLDGCNLGPPPYGYRIVRQFKEDGERERGLWEIVPEEAAVVKRIFTLYASGVSPIQIAKLLNQEGVPSPNGGLWYDTTIRGQKNRMDGILRRQTYHGRTVWAVQHRVRNPETRRSVRRQASEKDVVVVDRPMLRIIDETLWEEVQSRIAAVSLPRATDASQSQPHFSALRRPKHLLSGKAICACCGRSFCAIGKDYLGCAAAKHGVCHNTRTIRRSVLEARVMQDLAQQLMPPELVQEAIKAFNAELKTLQARLGEEAKEAKRQLKDVESQIKNLLDVLARGNASPSLMERLQHLDTQKAELTAKAAQQVTLNLPPALHPGNATVYAARVNALSEAMQQADNRAALEAARALIDKIVISPPGDEGDPLIIEVVGELTELLKASGIAALNANGLAQPSEAVLDLFASSVKDGPRARPLAGSGAEPQRLLASSTAPPPHPRQSAASARVG